MVKFSIFLATVSSLAWVLCEAFDAMTGAQ